MEAQVFAAREARGEKRPGAWVPKLEAPHHRCVDDAAPQSLCRGDQCCPMANKPTPRKHQPGDQTNKQDAGENRMPALRHYSGCASGLPSGPTWISDRLVPVRTCASYATSVPCLVSDSTSVILPRPASCRSPSRTAAGSESSATCSSISTTEPSPATRTSRLWPCTRISTS